MLDGTAESVLQRLANDDYGNQILVRVNIVVVPEIGRNLFLVMTAVKKSTVAIFGYENFRMRRLNLTVPLWSEVSDLYWSIPNWRVNRYDTKEPINAVAIVQVWHRRLVISMHRA